MKLFKTKSFYNKTDVEIRYLTNFSILKLYAMNKLHLSVYLCTPSGMVGQSVKHLARLQFVHSALFFFRPKRGCGKMISFCYSLVYNFMVKLTASAEKVGPRHAQHVPMKEFSH